MPVMPPARCCREAPQVRHEEQVWRTYMRHLCNIFIVLTKGCKRGQYKHCASVGGTVSTCSCKTLYTSEARTSPLRFKKSGQCEPTRSGPHDRWLASKEWRRLRGCGTCCAQMKRVAASLPNPRCRMRCIRSRVSLQRSHVAQ